MNMFLDAHNEICKAVKSELVKFAEEVNTILKDKGLISVVYYPNGVFAWENSFLVRFHVYMSDKDLGRGKSINFELTGKDRFKGQCLALDMYKINGEKFGTKTPEYTPSNVAKNILELLIESKNLAAIQID